MSLKDVSLKGLAAWLMQTSFHGGTRPVMTDADRAMGAKIELTYDSLSFTVPLHNEGEPGRWLTVDGTFVKGGRLVYGDWPRIRTEEHYVRRTFGAWLRRADGPVVEATRLKSTDLPGTWHQTREGKRMMVLVRELLERTCTETHRAHEERMNAVMAKAS